MKNSILWLSNFLLGALLLISSCGNPENKEEAESDEQEPTDIVTFAKNSEDYTILADALATANLTDALSGEGPFTVFAPNNAAFQALLDSNADWNGLADIPAETLSAVLTNHVVGGSKVMSTDLSEGYVTTLSQTSFNDAATSLYVNLDDGVTLNGTVNVEAPDVEATNGVIHGLDAVIDLPNIVTFATSNPNLSTLVAALTREDLEADFVSVLSSEGPFTVFAPTNDAFQSLLDSNDDWNGLEDIPAETLETVLSYHVSAAGNVRSTDLAQDMEVPTVAKNASLSVDLSGETPKIVGGSSSANVVLADIQSTNGVIHVIDTVLLP
jgi:uncharacterized surface protein with fasciclin (FAS1) repeats